MWTCDFSDDPASGVCIVPRRYAEAICNSKAECTGIGEPHNAEWMLMYPGKVQLTVGGNCYEPGGTLLLEEEKETKSVHSSPWHLQCNGEDACKDKTITFAGYGDIMTCSGDAACKAAAVTSHGSSDISCSGKDACRDAKIHCLEDGCVVRCTGESSCIAGSFVCAEGKTCYYTKTGKDSYVNVTEQGLWIKGTPPTQPGETLSSGATKYFSSNFPQTSAAPETGNWNYDERTQECRYRSGALSDVRCQARNWHRRNEDWVTCFKDPSLAQVSDDAARPQVGLLEARAAAAHGDDDGESVLLEAGLETSLSRKGCIDTC